MQPDPADLDARARIGAGVQEAGKPRQRYTPKCAPSVKSTHIVCSSKRTAVAEMVILHVCVKISSSGRLREDNPEAQDTRKFCAN